MHAQQIFINANCIDEILVSTGASVTLLHALVKPDIAFLEIERSEGK